MKRAVQTSRPRKHPVHKKKEPGFNIMRFLFAIVVICIILGLFFTLTSKRKTRDRTKNRKDENSKHKKRTHKEEDEIIIEPEISPVMEFIPKPKQCHKNEWQKIFKKGFEKEYQLGIRFHFRTIRSYCQWHFYFTQTPRKSKRNHSACSRMGGTVPGQKKGNHYFAPRIREIL